MPKIRVFIVDDHAVLRAGLRAIINSEPDMETVGEARDGREALKIIAETTADVILMDLTMPGMGGLQATKEILQINPNAKVLVLTMHEDPAYVRSVLTVGGSGYVVKTSEDSELMSAIRIVHQGHIFVDRSLSSSVIEELLRETHHPSGLQKSLLTKRETQALRLLAQGYTYKQIADRMGVSIKTVESYRSRITAKLKLRSRADLVRYASEMGFLAPNKLAAENH